MCAAKVVVKYVILQSFLLMAIEWFWCTVGEGRFIICCKNVWNNFSHIRNSFMVDLINSSTHENQWSKKHPCHLVTLAANIYVSDLVDCICYTKLVGSYTK
jgi:hypothetical protein